MWSLTVVFGIIARKYFKILFKFSIIAIEQIFKVILYTFYLLENEKTLGKDKIIKNVLSADACKEICIQRDKVT